MRPSPEASHGREVLSLGLACPRKGGPGKLELLVKVELGEVLWSGTPATPRLRQEVYELEVNSGCITSTCLKIKTREGRRHSLVGFLSSL